VFEREINRKLDTAIQCKEQVEKTYLVVRLRRCAELDPIAVCRVRADRIRQQFKIINIQIKDNAILLLLPS
jgi:hypothetical protein